MTHKSGESTVVKACFFFYIVKETLHVVFMSNRVTFLWYLLILVRGLLIV